MDSRRRGAVLAASGAAIAGASVPLGHNMAGVAGLSADFWRGVPLGTSLVFIIASVVLVVRSQRSCA